MHAGTGGYAAGGVDKGISGTGGGAGSGGYGSQGAPVAAGAGTGADPSLFHTCRMPTSCHVYLVLSAEFMLCLQAFTASVSMHQGGPQLVKWGVA